MLAEEFHNRLAEMLNQIKSLQGSVIESIAQEIAKKTIDGKILFAFGTGHSHVIAEELYIRAGGLFNAKAILEPEFMLHGTKWKSTALERIEGISKALLELNEVRSGDVIIIISNSGRNPVPIEMAIEAKKMGLMTVAITNLKHSESVDSRHHSGQKLYQVVDFCIDNCGEPGDTMLGVQDAPYRFGATSTITGSYIIQQLVISVIEEIRKRGETPPVLLSSNLDGSDQYNEEMLKDYFEKYPELKSLLK